MSTTAINIIGCPPDLGLGQLAENTHTTINKKMKQPTENMLTTYSTTLPFITTIDGKFESNVNKVAKNIMTYVNKTFPLTNHYTKINLESIKN